MSFGLFDFNCELSLQHFGQEILILLFIWICLKAAQTDLLLLLMNFWRENKIIVLEKSRDILNIPVILCVILLQYEQH